MRFNAYETGTFYDEMFESDGGSRGPRELLVRGSTRSRLASCSGGRRPPSWRCSTWASRSTSTATKPAPRKIWPFDIVPRIIENARMGLHRAGLKQRIPR